MKSGEAPQAPNYNELIPLQTQANKDQFNYALGAQRADTTTPFGTSRWEQTPTFDEPGFNEAMQKWQASGVPTQANGIWVPGSDGLVTREVGDTTVTDSGPGTSGHWEFAPGMTGGTGPMPTREQFTTNAWKNIQELSPEQQALYSKNVGSQLQQADLLKALTDRVGQATSQPLSFGGAPELTDSLQPTLRPGERDYNAGNPVQLSDIVAQLKGLNPSTFNTGVSDAMYNQATRYLTPQQGQQRSTLEARLAEQGFVPGTPGYSTSMGDLNKTQDMALADARDRSVLAGETAGGNEFSRMIQQISLLLGTQGQAFGQARNTSLDEDQNAQNLFQQQHAAGVFGNQARNQSISEMLTERQFPLNELSAMRSGTPVTSPALKSEYSVPNLGGVDMLGAAQNQYANEMGGYNADVAGDNATMGTVLSLIGTAFGAPWLGPLVMGLGGGGATTAPAGGGLNSSGSTWGMR